MCCLQVTCVVAYLLAAVGCTDAICRFTDKMKPVDVDFSQYVGKRLNIVYCTANAFSSTVDHATIDVTKTGDSQYFAVTSAYLKKGTIATLNYTIEYKNGVMLETYTFKDKKGENYQTRSYILANGNDSSLYYYRCSNEETPFDLRFIVAPVGKRLSIEIIKNMKSVDDSFDFISNIFKLPNKFS